MVAQVVAVAGGIKSGKSTRIAELAQALNADVRSFGDVVRAEAASRGRATERNGLQDTGMELISEGWDHFVSILLTPSPNAEYLLVDGIRHLEATAEIRRQLPGAHLTLVFVDTPPVEVVERLVEAHESPAALTHQVEAELPEVRRQADIVVPGLDLDADVRAILAALGNH